MTHAVDDSSLFTSHWISAPAYRIVVMTSGMPAALLHALERYRLAPLPYSSGIHHMQTGPDWAASWHVISALLADFPQTLAAILPGDGDTQEREIGFHLRPLGEIDSVAAHLWLAEALRDKRLLCYMQRVVDRRGVQIGYEAFARIEREKDVASGQQIITAARALRVEYMLDRMMHRLAVRSYRQGELEGYLFINFLPGFLHRPDRYLDGLDNAITGQRIDPRRIVLDIPIGALTAHAAQLQDVSTYCHARGIVLALDDVASPDGLAAALAALRPAFVKVTGPQGHSTPVALEPIVAIAHTAGAQVLAEGVESDAYDEGCRAAGVDLFQGYLFGKPERRYAPPPALAADNAPMHQGIDT